MCEHNGQLRIEQRGIEQIFGAYDVTGYCPDCDEVMWHGIRYDDRPEIEYTFVAPVWHGKTMIQAAGQIQELMAVVADNARKRSELEAEYREMTNRAIAAQKAAEQTAINRLNLLTSMRVRIVEIATDLARAGSYDHKSKNEVILRALAAMLAESRWRTDSIEATRTDNDDVPF